MVDKLKLISISFGTFYLDKVRYKEPVFYVFSYQDFIKYAKRTGHLSQLKRYFGKYGAFSLIQSSYDNKHIDYRSSALIIAQKLIYNYLFETFPLPSRFYVKVRIKTLCFDTSNKFYSAICAEGFTPFLKGYHNAMFPSALCLSKQLLNSRNWQEYNFISEKKF